MKNILLFFISFCLINSVTGQVSYSDSLLAFRKKYIDEHEVVRGNDRNFLRFFPVDPSLRVTARFERIEDASWFAMPTSGKEKSTFRIYGILHFKLQDSSLRLPVYQSKDLLLVPELADYLFLPFTDNTNGEESYENGRYIDLKTRDVEAGSYELDFNKAYNPYCAYISNTYSCPIPPKENALQLAIRAGEMKFAKEHK
jgi:uncharacterized protein